MRSILWWGCAALVAGFVSSEAVATQKPKAVRTIQVIVMRTSQVRAPREDRRTVPELDAIAPPAQPDARDFRKVFQTHDLSRRWVAFEMANSFSAVDAPAPVSSDGDPFAYVGIADPGRAPPNPRVSPPPGIAIPRWMLAGVAFSIAPTSFSRGCGVAAYHPSGFLDAGTEYRRLGYYEMMSNMACEYGIPVGLFDAMIIRESRYKAGIYSAKNAFGLTQLMPSTAAGLGVDRYDIEQNLRGGARYLRQQLDRFGQFHLALAAYNAGPGRVKDGALPRIAETQAYVENVLMNWRRLAAFSPRVTVASAAVRNADRPVQIGRTATVSSY